MDLISALKANKRIKRGTWIGWHNPANMMFLPSDILKEDWELEPDPEPKKPRLLAWVCTDPGLTYHGHVRLYTDLMSPDVSGWIRAPWLDQPKEKE